MHLDYKYHKYIPICIFKVLLCKLKNLHMWFHTFVCLCVDGNWSLDNRSPDHHSSKGKDCGGVPSCPALHSSSLLCWRWGMSLKFLLHLTILFFNFIQFASRPPFMNTIYYWITHSGVALCVPIFSCLFSFCNFSVRS